MILCNHEGGQVMKLKDRINEFLREKQYTEEEILFMDSSSVYIAQQISFYAHRNQRRLNGDYYFKHPYNVMSLYRDFTGIIEGDYFCVDIDLLVGECNIPYDGVQEVCLLHDVLEDTDVTLEEIENVFDELSLGEHFRRYIKIPLSLLTHDKSEDYVVYISKLIEHPVAALVKFMDMADNMNPSDLNKFGNAELERILKYAYYCKIINDRWLFLENICRYKKMFNESSAPSNNDSVGQN